MSDKPTMNSSDLWSAVASAQEPVVTNPAALEALRLSVMHNPLPKRRVPLWTAALVPLAAAAAWLVLVRGERAQTFQVGPVTGAVGVMLAADDKPLPVQFADGSTVILSAGSRGKVAELVSKGADVVLTQGSLEAHVVHAEHTRWVFHAGSFAIEVTGTRFRASWDPTRGAFEVAMKEGSVRVTGGDLGEPVRLTAGQTLRVDGASPAKALGSAAQDKAAPIATQVPAVEPPVQPGEAEPTNARGPRAAVSDIRWQDLAAKGRHIEALTLAKRAGFERLLRQLPAPELLLLADSARYAQQAPLAERAFTVLVQRFAQAPESLDAAFALGRLAYTQERWQQSAQWFERVTRSEAPEPLQQAAWQRLMESQERAGDVAGAKKTATRYLQGSPHGVHKAIAARLMRMKD
ncbi:MAG: FecR domain-containing protein [Deltaproteobacteria bacterium]|nr:FecR domain-containing protein [Deltaproteobacteria bacterium]